MWWSVYIEVADDDTEDPVSVEQLEKLADLLEPRSASVGGGGGQYSARLSVEADRDRAAADQALMEFAKAREKARLPKWPVVHLDLMTEERLDAELAEPPFPEVVGVAEAAKLLGVSKQRVLQLTERDDFPAPMVRLAAGPVWLAASIRAFDQRWSRKPGRPAGSMRDAADVSGTVIAAQQVFARSAARVRKPAAVAKSAAKSAAYAVKSSKTGKVKSGKGRKRDVGQD
jgi:hypothetical protein